MYVISWGQFFYRLAEVGKLEPPKTDGNNYSGGQMFLHRLFGYRGVILFPWSARVYDRDKFREKKDSPSSTPSAASSNTSTPQSPDNPMGYHPPSQAPPGNLDCDALGQWRGLEDLLFLFMAVFPAGAEQAFHFRSFSFIKQRWEGG